MMDPVEAVKLAGKTVLEVEHDNFMNAVIDNREHIPRLLRIAVAMANVFREDGQSEGVADEVEEELLSFGKQLFMNGWMQDLMPNEDPQQVFDRGSREFDRIMCEHDG